MAKKAGTQIIEFLKGLTPDSSSNLTITSADRDWMVRLLKRVDKRDEQSRKNTKPIVRTKKKSARSVLRARR